jgi:hypothetical protein
MLRPPHSIFTIGDIASAEEAGRVPSDAKQAIDVARAAFSASSRNFGLSSAPEGIEEIAQSNHDALTFCQTMEMRFSVQAGRLS